MSHLASSMSWRDKGGEEETAAKICSACREEGKEDLIQGEKITSPRLAIQVAMYGVSACDTVMSLAGGKEEQF